MNDALSFCIRWIGWGGLIIVSIVVALGLSGLAIFLYRRKLSGQATGATTMPTDTEAKHVSFWRIPWVILIAIATLVAVIYIKEIFFVSIPVFIVVFWSVFLMRKKSIGLLITSILLLFSDIPLLALFVWMLSVPQWRWELSTWQEPFGMLMAIVFLALGILGIIVSSSMISRKISGRE